MFVRVENYPFNYMWYMKINIPQALNKDDLIARAYDKFHVELKQIQLLYAKPGEDWQAARKQQTSKMHVLEQLTFDIELFHAFMQDVSLPK